MLWRRARREEFIAHSAREPKSRQAEVVANLPLSEEIRSKTATVPYVPIPNWITSKRGGGGSYVFELPPPLCREEGGGSAMATIWHNTRYEFPRAGATDLNGRRRIPMECLVLVDERGQKQS